MSLLGLGSHYFIGNGSHLIAVLGSPHFCTMVRKNNQWQKGATLTGSVYASMASLNDSAFVVNGVDPMWEYNGSYWTIYENSLGAPIGKYIFTNQNRLYLYEVKILGSLYASRVMFSDITDGDVITWGFEEGTDLAMTAGSETVTSASSFFNTRNIKIGDPFYITTGQNRRSKPYIVQSIDSDTQITLTEELSFTETGKSFWTGGNWFDVGKDDGDFAMGIGNASNELIFFKRDSVYRYNPGSEDLRQIKDLPGTYNARSIVSWGGYCYWIHPSGVYRTSGGGGERISNAISDIFSEDITIQDLSQGSAWVNKTENTINFCILDTIFQDGSEYDNFVISYDVDMNIWSFRNYPVRISVTAQWLTSDESRIYFGDNGNSVYQLDTGNDFNGSDIPFELELHPIYPEGEDAVVTFHRLRAYVKDGPDIQIFYKLLYKPRYGVEGVFDSDDNWRALEGSQIAERVDWYFPVGSRASGVKIKVVESGGDKSFTLEKMTLYCSDPANF